MQQVKKIIGYTPHCGQAELHELMNSGKYFYYTFNIGRQWGKTMMMINQLLQFTNNSNYDIAFIAPTLKQSRRVFLEIMKYTANVPAFEFNKSTLTITRNNGTTVDFHSAEQADNIRGFHYHIVIRDESAFMKDGFYHEIIAPMLIVKGIADISISTPKGRNSDHYRRYIQGFNNKLYYSHTATSLSNPLANKDILKDIKRQTPDHIWKQEYLAQFLDGGVLFKNIDKCTVSDIIQEPKGRLFGGLDIGRADDYTVLTIMDEDNNVILIERWRHSMWHVIVQAVARRIKKYDAQTVVEINSIGDIFKENLEKELGAKKNLLTPFFTTNETKKDIIENLILDFEQENITIPDVDWLKMELEAFTFVYTHSTKKVRYSAPNGLHDDGVISLALARESARQNKRKGKYVFGY